MDEGLSLTEADAPQIWRRFRDMFSGFGCGLPESLDPGGDFDCGEWSFRYAVNHDGEPCLDVVAESAHAGPQLHRFRASGAVESGPDFESVLVVEPDDTDLSVAEMRQRAHNEHVADTLRARGLL